MFPAPGELLFLNIAFLVVGPILTNLLLSKTSRKDDRVMAAVSLGTFVVLFPIVYAHDVSLRPNIAFMAVCFFASSAITAAIIGAARFLRHAVPVRG